MNYEQKYYGPDKIIKVEKLDHETPSKKPVYKLVFDGELDYVVLGEDACKKLITEKPVDAGNFEITRYQILYPFIASILLEYGFTYGETPRFLNWVGDNILDVFERADHKLWTKSTNGFVSKTNAKEMRSLIEADMILTTEEDGKPTYKTKE